MILALLAGIIIGFVLALPPGPVAVQVIRGALDKKFLAALAIGAGAAITDILYCFGMLALTSSLHGQFSSLLSDFPLGFLIFQIACVVIMIGYGIISLRSVKNKRTVSSATEECSSKDKIVSKISSYGPFFIGVGLAGANLANPTFLPSLAVL
jgi:threonine/homoserine/homoserine lactone efflux protein